MHVYFLKKRPQLLVALIISAVLFLAALTKLFFPRPAFILLDRTVAIFEIIFICFLLAFHRRWHMWLACLGLFATWAGFSFFWLLWGQPCGCLGNWATPPPGVLFGIDLILAALGARMLYRFKPKGFRLALLSALFLSILGFLAAYGFYKYIFK
jgi:hypothetical protein